MTSYRLGLDIGTNSIGWCALTLDEDDNPSGLLDCGVRVMSSNEAPAGLSPKNSSLAAERRRARGQRRRRDRFLRRKKALMCTLVKSGLMPEDEAARKELEKLDPYFLRGEAATEQVSLFELGRLLFHLNQRRGFKSNRLAGSKEGEETSTKVAIKKLENELGHGATLGQYLSARHNRNKEGKLDRDGNPLSSAKIQTVRFRPEVQGAKNLYDFYPTRQMVEREIDQIWEKQREFHPEGVLTDDLLKKLKRIIIDQRDLKKPVVGRCSRRPDEEIVERYDLKIPIDNGERIPKAHPLFQRFRILQDTANLEIVRPGRRPQKLTIEQRDKIKAMLKERTAHTIKFEQMGKAIKLPDDARFNFENGIRKGFESDQVSALLSNKKHFGSAWKGFSLDKQIEIVEHLLFVEEEGALIKYLCETHGIDPEAADRISDVRLPQGYGNLGRGVLAELVSVMEKESVDSSIEETGEVFDSPITYDKALDKLGLHHSNDNVEKLRKLPYYGEILTRHVVSNSEAPEGSQDRIGRISNPTVHIGLNQVKKLVNSLIDRYGTPKQIVVELSRDLKNSRKRKEEIQREQKENRERNFEILRSLEKLGKGQNQNLEPTPGNLLIMRLFYELKKSGMPVCIYSGKPISMGMLFSGEVEVDHILPFSRTLDDSFANKILCTRESNRRKGNQTPAEAWSGEELEKIAMRAGDLIRKKSWRFAPDAMERFEETHDFIQRQLTDTQYMSRISRVYLQHVCERVDVTPGRLTALLRGKWGLNNILQSHNSEGEGQFKNRNDHRHHAVDAFVIACTDRRTLQRVSSISAISEEQGLTRLFDGGEFPEPFAGFRDALREKLQTVVISHKPDHGISRRKSTAGSTSGRLLEETAYGCVKENAEGYNLVTRKPITSLFETELKHIRDEKIRNTVIEYVKNKKEAGIKFEDALVEFGKENNIRRVRILKKDESAIVIDHGEKHSKSYIPGENHCIEIYELPDGSWKGEGVTVYNANKKGFKPKWRLTNPHAKLIMRVHKGDMLKVDFGDGIMYAKVCILEPSANRLILASHNEAGKLKTRHKDLEDPFRYYMKSYSVLKDAGAVLVKVNPT